MKQLPSHVTRYKSTPEFTEHTVPKGLLKDHKTKQGVWGLILVHKGQIEYKITEPEEQSVYLSSDLAGVVEPAIAPYIKPLAEVRFHVEFYR